MIKWKKTLPKWHPQLWWRYVFPYDISPVFIEDCVNNEHEDSIRNGLVEKNDTKVNDEVREISIDTENKDVIHRDITDNET